jgi:ABC-type cobalamin transport system permease subunit
MDVKRNDSAQRIYASAEQLRYAKVLNVGMRLGLAVLIAGFIAYLAGVVPPHVPLEQMPALWTLSAPD